MSTKTGRNSHVYGRFAEVYDRIGMDRFSTRMVAYSLEVLQRHKVQAKRVLDVCCGTGTAVRLFAEHGCSVVGVDQSAEMLRVGREKCRGLDATFYRSVLPELELPKRVVGTGFDLVTSYFDALNYILDERKLTATFRAAYRCTAPGGWLLFDMNTLAGLGKWPPVHGDATDDLAWVFRASFDKRLRLALCRITFFERQGRRWARYDEDHFERGYTPTEIKRMVRAAGYVVHGVYDTWSFGKVKPDAGRICVVAQKRR